MKFLKNLKLVFFLAVLAFASCKKDELNITEGPDGPAPTESHVNGLLSRSNGDGTGIDMGCVSIDYPFSMITVDSSTVEITSDDEFFEAISDEDNYVIDFVYPLNATDQDGNSLVVANVDELAELFADCIPDTGWDDDFGDWFFPAWDISYENSCYLLAYPITLINQDSATVVANNNGELIALLADGNIYSFTFPLGLIDQDGNSVTADDADDLFELLAECGPGPGNGGCGIGTFACYELGYPATVLLIDGSTVVVNDDNEFAEVMVSGEWAGFEYPLNLIDEDGNTVTVNNEEELYEAMMNCDPSWGGGGGGPGGIEILIGCYELGYPSTFQLLDGTTVVVNDVNEFNNVLMTGNFAGFGYPMTLVDEDGNSSVVNDEQQLDDALLECEDFGGNPGYDEGDFFCYDFTYPISISELTTGNQVTFNNSSDWEAYQNNPVLGPFDFIFPVTLVDEDGNEVTVGSQMELFGAVEDCW